MARVRRQDLDDHVQTHDRQNSWWLNDAKGIPLRRVCDDCVDTVKSMYKPEVIGESYTYRAYEDVVEDVIESEDS